MKKKQTAVPPQFTPAMAESDIVYTMMKWLNDQGCAVVVFTEAELNGAEIHKVEGMMIEHGFESIFALTGSNSLGK